MFHIVLLYQCVYYSDQRAIKGTVSRDGGQVGPKLRFANTFLRLKINRFKPTVRRVRASIDGKSGFSDQADFSTTRNQINFKLPLLFQRSGSDQKDWIQLGWDPYP
jgi:hypothetical protein